MKYTYLALGCLPLLHTEARFRHGLVDDANRVWSLCRRVDAFLGYKRGNLPAQGRQIVVTLFLANLKLALLQNLSRADRICPTAASWHDKGCTHLLHDVVRLGSAKGFLEVLVLGYFAFRDVHEHVLYLEHVIDVRLDSVSPFLDLVLVACNLVEQSTCYGHASSM